MERAVNFHTIPPKFLVKEVVKMKVDNENLILKGTDETMYTIPVNCIDDVVTDSENGTIQIKFRREVWKAVGCCSITFKYSSADDVNKIASDYYSKKYAGWF